MPAVLKKAVKLNSSLTHSPCFPVRYADATEEDLASGDNVCIICREDMVSGCKKLPCNHIFHTSCLRSWFQRQQICPTCRMDVLRQPRPQQQQQQQQPQQQPQQQQSKCFGHYVWDMIKENKNYICCDLNVQCYHKHLLMPLLSLHG